MGWLISLVPGLGGLQKIAIEALFLFGVAAVLLLSFEGYVSSVKRHAAAERDLVWENKIAKANADHEKDKQRIRLAAEQAAAIERGAAMARVTEHQSRAVALQQELDRIKDDPVVFPRALAKALRR